MKTPDELSAELSDKLATVERAIFDAVRAKTELIDASVDLDVTQKQLADLEKNREAQVLAKVRPCNQPAVKPPGVAAAEPTRPSAPAK